MLEEKPLKEPTLESYDLDADVYNRYLNIKDEIRKYSSSIPEIKKLSISDGIMWCIYFLCSGSVSLIFYFNGVNFDDSFYWSLFLGFFCWLVVACLLLFILETEFVANIISLGKYKKKKEERRLLQDQIKLLQDKVEHIRKQVDPFESACKIYFEDRLREFFNINLYRKRSGSDAFEKGLSQFSSLISEAEEVNKVLITKRIYVSEYQEYLANRQVNHSYQKEKDNNLFGSFNKVIKGVTERQQAKKPLPPEVLYAKPRKVDWDDINKKRQITGLRGEEIVLSMQRDYLKSIGREDLSDRVCHVSVERGDGLGYDIASFFDDGTDKYIEVKTTKSSINTPFLISKNEMEFLRNNNMNSFIYRLCISNDEDKESIPTLEVFTATEVLNSENIIPVEYMIKINR